MITEENEPELSRKKSQKKVTIEETATKKSKKKREEQRPKFYLNESRTLLTAVNEKRERMEMQTNGASMSSLRSSSAPGLSSKKSIEVVVESRRSTSEKVSDFFCTSKKPKSIRLPNINLQRGPIIAIFFTILISTIILWHFFSSDSGEHEEEHIVTRKGNRYISPSRTTKWAKNTSGYDMSASPDESHRHTNEEPTELVFVLLTTLLIVLAIIAFVFVGAMIHYYKKPNPFAPPSASSSTPDGGRRLHRSFSIVSSIFTHHSHHNFLYYLEKANDENSAAKSPSAVDEVKIERRDSKKRLKKCNSTGSRKTLNPNDACVATSPTTPSSPSIATTTPPIIIVNETK